MVVGHCVRLLRTKRGSEGGSKERVRGAERARERPEREDLICSQIAFATAMLAEGAAIPLALPFRRCLEGAPKVFDKGSSDEHCVQGRGGNWEMKVSGLKNASLARIRIGFKPS